LLLGCDQQPAAKTPGLVPSAPSDAGTAVLNNPETFAIDTLYLGDTFRAGESHASSDEPWMYFGYNLDSLCTVANSSPACTLVDPTKQSVQQDGRECRDNSWGSTLLPMLTSSFWYNDGTVIVPNISDTVTKLIRGGAWTLELTTDGLNPATADLVGLTLQVRVGASMLAPTFDSALDWPVLESSVLSPAQSALHFDSSYVSAGTFVSGASAFVDGQRAPVVLPLALSGGQIDGGPWPLVLRIHNPVVTFTRSTDDPAHLRNGVIAGTLDVDEAIASAHVLVEHVSGAESLACGPPFDALAYDIGAAVDILSNGSNVQNTPCKAISIGIGFDATQVANPTTSVPDPPPPADTCVEAGAPDSPSD
jgi:hypothetical protein